MIKENIFPLEWSLTDDLVVPYHGKKVFGTFVCGGGSTMGYKLAGYQHLGGVEFTKKYAQVYTANHNPKYFYLEDIRDFNTRTDLPDELFELDLLDGSPPCSAFSSAGARERLWGKESNYEDKKIVKDDLVYVYCDTIEKLLPKVFLLENVSGLMKGNARMYLKNIVTRLREHYNVQVFLLYGASMGIPQMRNRVFIIGHRKELALDKLDLSFDCPQTTFSITQKYENHETNESRMIPTHVKDYQLYDEIKAGGIHLIRFGRRKTHPRKPTHTFVETDATGAGHLWHHKQKRGLNLEEVRMISTFPKDFDFAGQNPYSVMGRSVLPVMMANISNQIYQQWLKNV